MKFIKHVAFNTEADMEQIVGISEGKLISFAAHQIQSKSDSLRIYLVTMDHVPIAVFDGVPEDLFLKILCARSSTFNDNQNPNLIRVAAFDGDNCTVVNWISIAPAIWASLILSEYLVTDLRFFLNEGTRNFLEKIHDKALR